MSSHSPKGFLGDTVVKNLPAMQEIWVWPLGEEDPLEKGMATHPSILAWRIPWAEEPGGLQFMGSQRGGHDWVTKHSTQDIGAPSSNLGDQEHICLCLMLVVSCRAKKLDLCDMGWWWGCRPVWGQWLLCGNSEGGEQQSWVERALRVLHVGCLFVGGRCEMHSSPEGET